MKVNFIIPSILAAGLLAGGLALTGAGQAEPAKSGGEAVTVAAAGDALAVSKKRRKLMKGQNTPWKKLNRAAKKGNIGPKEVARAQKIAGNLKQLQGMFGDKGTGSDMIKSRAKPAIWKNKADFDKRLAKALKEANAGLKAAQAGDAKGVASAMKAIGCNGCHKKYRGKKPN